MGTDADQRMKLVEIERSDVSEALKKAMSFVVKRSMPIPKTIPPEALDELEFPEDLTNLTISQLGQAMGVWTSVLAYVQYEVAMADIEQTAKKNQLEFEKKKYYLELAQDRELNENERAAKLIADERMARLQVKFENARARFTLMKALLGAYSKYYNALSRELSRRGIGEAVPEPPEPDDDVDMSPTPSLFKSMGDDEEPEE